jgi:hypothetical protein
MRIGKLQVTTEFESDEGVFESIKSYNIIEVDAGTTSLIGVSPVDDPTKDIVWKYGFNINDEYYLDKVFNVMGKNTYDWVEPMHGTDEDIYS